MMAKIELPATKSSLRKIKEELAFAYEGHDLLNQKRELLVIAIVGKLGEIRRMERDFLDVLNELYTAYRDAAVDMGSQALTLKSCSAERSYTLQLQLTKHMGLKLPAMTLALSPPNPSGGIAQTSASYDAAQHYSRRAVKALVEYAAVAKEVILLARELKRVQRRVNALEKVFIPPREEARKHIADRIEEMERDEVFVKKLIRRKIEG